MHISSDDFSLIKDCISGKREAWDIFVKRFSKLIYHSISKTLQLYSHNLQQEDTEDIYNSIFLSFLDKNYKKLRQFEGKCSLASWIRLISIRRTVDFLRSQRHVISLNNDSDDTPPIIDRIPDNKESVDEQLDLRNTETMIRKTIEVLPPPDRLFMKLYYEDELFPEEIADIMNVSVNTIYSKKNRIRKKIKNILMDRGIMGRNSN